MKKGPIILLCILVLALVFIMGVQYGKRVDTTEEAIQLVLTIIPTPTTTVPEGKKTHAFSTFESKSCGFSFIYPTDLTPRAESSLSGKLELEEESSTSPISFSCNTALELDSIENTATTSVMLGNRQLTGYRDENTQTITIQMRHPTRPMDIRINFADRYKALIENTLEFIP